MKASIAPPPCGIRPRSQHFSGKDNKKVSKRTTKPNQNMSKRENYPRKHWAMKRKPALQQRALFVSPLQTLRPQRLRVSLTITQTRLPRREPAQLLLTEELVTQ